MPNDDPDQEDLGGDAEGRARGDLGGEDGGDPTAVEFGHITPGATDGASGGRSTLD